MNIKNYKTLGLLIMASVSVSSCSIPSFSQGLSSQSLFSQSQSLTSQSLTSQSLTSQSLTSQSVSSSQRFVSQTQSLTSQTGARIDTVGRVKKISMPESRTISRPVPSNRRILSPVPDTIRESKKFSQPTSLARKPRIAPDNAEKYYVVVGTFPDSQQAMSQFIRVSSIGLTKATMETRKKGGKTLHMVRLGPFIYQDEIDHVKDRLRSDGLSTFTVVKN